MIWSKLYGSVEQLIKLFVIKLMKIFADTFPQWTMTRSSNVCESYWRVNSSIPKGPARRDKSSYISLKDIATRRTVIMAEQDCVWFLKRQDTNNQIVQTNNSFSIKAPVFWCLHNVIKSIASTNVKTFLT